MMKEIPAEYNRFPENWDILPFTDAFKDKTGGQTKIQKGDYLDNGELPIIDQGQSLIGGYTDDITASCNVELPCVLFGDHTKIFKFIDTPFAIGADGVKVLSQRENIDSKFAYYYFGTLNLPDVGYSRHFRFLKRTFFPFPFLEEQKHIAAILDKADAIRRKRKEAIALTEELLRSTFLDMFGDPVTNPKGWESGTILDVVSNPKTGVRCGPFGTQLKVHELVSEGIPLYGIENVKGGKLIPATAKYLTELKAKELSAFDVKTDDVLVTRMGTIGHACVIPKGIEEARISCHLFRIRSNPEKCLPGFLAATITRSGTFMRQLQRLSHGAIMSGLKTADLKEVRFLIPPIKLQKKYLKVVEQTEQTISHQNQALEEKEILFNSLLQKAFRGEL